MTRGVRSMFLLAPLYASVDFCRVVVCHQPPTQRAHKSSWKWTWRGERRKNCRIISTQTHSKRPELCMERFHYTLFTTTPPFTAWRAFKHFFYPFRQTNKFRTHTTSSPHLHSVATSIICLFIDLQKKSRAHRFKASTANIIAPVGFFARSCAVVRKMKSDLHKAAKRQRWTRWQKGTIKQVLHSLSLPLTCLWGGFLSRRLRFRTGTPCTPRCSVFRRGCCAKNNLVCVW